MSEDVNCGYCGTSLSPDDDSLELHTGSTHYAATCREYVFAVKESYRKQAQEAEAAAQKWRERAAELEAKLADAERLNDHAHDSGVAMGGRLTVERIVAWLLRDDVVHSYSNTQDVAYAIEAGRWKRGEGGGE